MFSITARAQTLTDVIDKGSTAKDDHILLSVLIVRDRVDSQRSWTAN